MIDAVEIYLGKAQASLAGAESEAANGRYDNCANRAYYACFQAGIAALLKVGIRPPNALGHWNHAFVPGQFVGQLINRRKVYPVSVRETLPLLYQLRQAADYSDDLVTQTQALRALRRAREFVLVVVREQAGESR
jgi:uncharacterized protein (UPF0332 family)